MKGGLRDDRYEELFYICSQTKYLSLDNKTSLDRHQCANIVQGHLGLIKDFPVKKILLFFFFTLKNLPTFHWDFHNQLHNCKGIHPSQPDTLNKFSLVLSVQDLISSHKPISFRIHSHVRGLHSPLQEQPQVSLLSLMVLISYKCQCKYHPASPMISDKNTSASSLSMLKIP